MKKYLVLFLSAILCLTACNKKDGNDDIYIEKDPVLVDDKELMTYDELPMFYDNKITVNGKDAPDPFIMRYNGYYYLYATNGSRYLLGYKSEDLYNVLREWNS